MGVAGPKTLVQQVWQLTIQVPISIKTMVEICVQDPPGSRNQEKATQETRHQEGRRRLAYTDEANLALDEPIATEVREAMLSATKNTTPGNDGISNAMIRNLDDKSITRFTEFINEHWEQVTIPNDWENAEIID
ncbi:hypothetical protein HPB51_027421 [Rhipicephalus microplus]|uniref:Tick transposon n=1 Tax=Rhipicephalus microplus TaxID=6941 RepID=A0A9J6D0E2_RHIMP|nr:hypothetical protein HPB51_027421 [Rhipicephalus microplus]